MWCKSHISIAAVSITLLMAIKFLEILKDINGEVFFIIIFSTSALHISCNHKLGSLTHKRPFWNKHVRILRKPWKKWGQNSLV